MSNPDLNSILNAFSYPVLVAKPILKDNKIEDFELIFINNAFVDKINPAISSCHYFHEIVPLITKDVPWLDIATDAYNGITHPPVTYYSNLSKAWFKVDMKISHDKLLVLNLENVTKNKEQDQKLRETAYTDPLTKLYNRTRFILDFEGIIEETRLQSAKLGILLIDIDNMKNTNDSKGHVEGDTVIKKASKVLKEFNNNNISLYRYGDDEFIVLIKNSPSIDYITNVTDAIYESFSREGLSVSGGISVYPDNSVIGEDLLKFTDIAIHWAKKDGKNRFTMFENDMQRLFIQKLNIQQHIAKAIEDYNFTQVYQPQFDIKTSKLRGFEALIRWNDKELGNIPPSIFIPIAEETGLIVELGKWIINKAFQTLKKWQTNYNFNGILSINISPIQLKQKDFIEKIKNGATTYGIDPKYVEIEITEGIMIENMEDAISKLNLLKEYGFKISLDDFGTGYSSLSYLQALPLNTLKIDKSFINNITAKDGVQANITNSIINMVSKMGLETIAEGVERDDQLEMLKNFNCQIVQGYLRGKPMSEEVCDEWLGGNPDALVTIRNDKHKQEQ